MNANYQKGRRFEYERVAHYKSLGMGVIRGAGSHGEWDLVATDWSRGLVYHIQCKSVGSMVTANRLLTRFRESPPHIPQAGCYQRLEVKVKGSTEVHSVTI